MSTRELIRKMAEDPELQPLRQFADGHTYAFSFDEFEALLANVVPAVFGREYATQEEERMTQEINEIFGILKLYRLHEFMLKAILEGDWHVLGVDTREPNALLIQELEEKLEELR